MSADWFLIYVAFVILSPVTVYSSDTTTPCELRLILGLPSCDEDGASNPNTTYQFCNIPRKYLSSVKSTITCDELQRYNPVCKKNITVTYTDSPPYIHVNSAGRAHGMLLSKLYHTFLG